MARTNKQTQIIDAVVSEVPATEQAQIAELLAKVSDAAELAGVLQQHPTLIKAITAALATTTVIVTANTACQALAVGAVMLTGSAVVGTITFYGLIAVVVGLLLNGREGLDALGAMLIMHIKRGVTKLKELASAFWNWVKEKCAALWNWITSFFQSEEKAVAAA